MFPAKVQVTGASKLQLDISFEKNEPKPGQGVNARELGPPSHLEKILVESEKILIQSDLVFKKVDAFECQKIQNSKSSM